MSEQRQQRQTKFPTARDDATSTGQCSPQIGKWVLPKQSKFISEKFNRCLFGVHLNDTIGFSESSEANLENVYEVRASWLKEKFSIKDEVSYLELSIRPALPI